ncbi:MAG: type II toxin-antitoxin system VapC family toxin [Chloroflexi bacterium]|nr:type II toxin-antitoxin system VapC family toxin [Chloroflexota bacterium]
MITAVDTNVLLDLLAGDDTAASSSRLVLEEVLAAGQVAICPVVCTELAAGFAQREDAIQFIKDLQIRVDGFSTEALLQAAAAWQRYTARRGKQVQCPRCGHKAVIQCPGCGAPLAWRQHIIADFLVGGHASHQANRLLTRDIGYYRAYFPGLRLVTPGAPAR